MTTILFDGWSLIYHPDSPAALHLLALLAYQPQQIEAIVAFPAEPPAWMPDVRAHIQLTPDTPFERLRWEQRTLAKIAQQLGAGLIHLTTSTPALFGKAISLISPSEYGFSLDPGIAAQARTGDHETGQALGERLRLALGSGGLERARAILWPEDLPSPVVSTPLLQLPPCVHPAFKPADNGDHTDLASLDLPETYVLYHGPGTPQALQPLLEAWSWAAGSFGESYPLVLLGLQSTGLDWLNRSLGKSDIGDTIHVLPPVQPGLIPGIYRGSAALLHTPEISPWGDPVRHALACGKPVVAVETVFTDAIVGPAAYLVPAGDARALGAALISVIVEEEVAAKLSRAALKRSRIWQKNDFGKALLDAYRSLSPHSDP